MSPDPRRSTADDLLIQSLRAEVDFLMDAMKRRDLVLVSAGRFISGNYLAAKYAAGKRGVIEAIRSLVSWEGGPELGASLPPVDGTGQSTGTSPAGLIFGHRFVPCDWRAPDAECRHDALCHHAVREARGMDDGEWCWQPRESHYGGFAEEVASAQAELAKAQPEALRTLRIVEGKL